MILINLKESGFFVQPARTNETKHGSSRIQSQNPIRLSQSCTVSPWTPPKLKNFSITASPKRISAGPMLIQLTALWLRRLWPKLARDPKYLGAQIGLISVLHTWGQNLLHHPHLHCIVPGGGLSLDGRRWFNSKKKFFIPVKVLSRKFRGKFLALFKQAVQNGEIKFLACSTLPRALYSPGGDYKQPVC